jgi:uncharacterized coiled-coil protein SlyX
MNEDRITELESALAFQDKTLQDLSTVILQQQKELDLLKVQVKSIQRRLLQDKHEESPGDYSAEQDRPPHY